MAMGDDDKVSGALDQAKGRVKRAWGELTDDPETKAEGSLDKLSGKLKELKGEVKNALDPDRRR
jgi:uncharacterized protein YjbJ (UPF0337 family)